MTVNTQQYRRDRVTWTAFGALFAFGFVNAALGPALPYLRAVEHIDYLTGALHQVAYAIGGGLAGYLAARTRGSIDRGRMIAGGLSGAALAGLAVGYGNTAAVTIAGAFVMSLLGTAALIRVWAVIADVHGPQRAVAMTEGEIPVSLAGILTPLLIGLFAATSLGWRFAFVVGAVATWLAALRVWRVGVPPTRDAEVTTHARTRLQPTLIVVFAIVALEFTLSFWLASYLSDDVGLSRGAAATAVAALFAAHLAGRLLASRLSRRIDAERLLFLAFGTALLGLPFLLAAKSAGVAAVGIAVTGMGIGAMFPLTSALHVRDTPSSADSALGQVLTVAAVGQIAGPLTAGAIAQGADLRAGLAILPLLVVIAATALRRT